MRMLVLFAHPVETSFGAALHDRVVGDAAARAGTKSTIAISTPKASIPVMTPAGSARLSRRRRSTARASAPYVDRLLAAEALVLVVPGLEQGEGGVAPGARCDYLAHYDMNHTTPERRAAFLRKVEATFARW